MSLFGTPVTQYPVVPVMDVDYTGINDSTAALTAAQNALKLTGKYGTMLLGAGTVILNDFNLLPMFSLKGPGKRLLTVSPTTPVVACIIVKALLPDYTNFQGYNAYTPKIEDMNINGNHVGTGIHGIYCPNAANDDPNYPASNNSKAYGSVHIYRCNVINFSGDNVHSEANRHRFYCEDLYSIGAGGHGITVGGSDPVIGPRTGAGSCGTTGTGFAIFFNNAAGCIMSAVNAWGPGGSRNDGSTAVKAANCNGVLIVGCVFNDTIQIVGVDKTTRSANITGNQFRPLPSMFSANGVPIGTGTSATNCFIYVTANDMTTVIGNDFNLTNNTAFTFDRLLNARNGAQVYFNYYFSGANGEKTWANAGTLPYTASGVGPDGFGAKVVGMGGDIGNGVVRIGGGDVQIVMNGGDNFDPTVVPNSACGINFVHPQDLPSRFGTPLWLQDTLCINYGSATIASGSATVNKAVNFFKINGSGSGAFNLTLPAIQQIDGQALKVHVQAGVTVTAFTYTPQNAAIVASDLPASATGPYDFWIVYNIGTNTWSRF